MVGPRHLKVAWSRDQPFAPWEAALAGLSWSGKLIEGSNSPPANGMVLPGFLHGRLPWLPSPHACLACMYGRLPCCPPHMPASPACMAAGHMREGSTSPPAHGVVLPAWQTTLLPSPHACLACMHGRWSHALVCLLHVDWCGHMHG
ncbi:hypothetical protein V6N11_050501 [Hibiscus sabdariffa]|uniref:Uncharacterized protein n=1 Tax=Hibiscus sabdariffa TaxID=183260 RepID=A0ABR2T9Z2_9ROSI